MYKLSRLMLIGTVLSTFACVAVLAEKLGGAILFWIGIALLVGFARRGDARRRRARSHRCREG